MTTILVAEDDPAVRELVAEVLTWEGYRVLQARDGQEALAALRREGADVVLSDVLMPGMGGLELAAAIRAEPAMANVPVVLFSGGIGEPAGKGTLYDAYLPKPFHVADVIALVEGTR